MQSSAHTGKLILRPHAIPHPTEMGKRALDGLHQLPHLSSKFSNRENCLNLVWAEEAHAAGLGAHLKGSGNYATCGWRVGSVSHPAPCGASSTLSVNLWECSPSAWRVFPFLPSPALPFASRYVQMIPVSHTEPHWWSTLLFTHWCLLWLCFPQFCDLCHPVPVASELIFSN